MAEDQETVIAALRHHGDRLRVARDSEQEELDAIADLLPRAVDAGLRKQDIARLAGVGRPWIDRTLARLAQSDGS